MNKKIITAVCALALSVSAIADAKLTKVPRWVHGFSLGAELATHRISCKNLKGEWDYKFETCDHPVVPKFGSPYTIGFKWRWDEDGLNRKGVKFIYVGNYNYQKEWFDYLYKTFGEPSYKRNVETGEWTVVWLLEDGVVSFSSLNQLSDGTIPDGYSVLYGLHEVISNEN